MESEDRVFKKRKLLLCEGPTDYAFIRMLFPIDGTGSEFEIRKVSDLNCGNGLGAYSNFLERVVGLESFSQIERLILLYDNDADPQDQFTAVVSSIEKANKKLDRNYYPIPTSPISPAKTKRLWLSCVPIPARNKPGALETLLLELIKPTYQKYVRCAETMFNCATHGGTHWTETKRAKAILVSALAHIYAKQPAAPLGSQITKNHKIFDANHKLVGGLRKAIARTFS